MPFISVEALDTPPPPDRRTLTDTVYMHLRERLVTGRLAPGGRLSLREISGVLGVSVMPVREAVNRLVAEGALEITANRVLRVPLTTPDQIRDLADIRAVVEGFAAERAAQARTIAQLDMIAAAEAALRGVVGSGVQDPGQLIALNRTLHFAIYEAAALPTLFKIITDLWSRNGPLLSSDVWTEPNRLFDATVVAYHADAVRAIASRDGAAARLAIANDIQHAAAQIIARRQLLTA